MSEAGAASGADSRCPGCGASFRCGMLAGDARCWCATLPALPRLPLPPPGTTASCYCPACLQALKAELAGEAPTQ